MSLSESVEYFKESARREFGFLQDDYGFLETILPKNSNECSVLYQNDTTKVLVEGTHWGSSARVAFGSVASTKFENYDLGDLLKVLGKEKLSVDEYSKLNQEEQLEYFSEMLSEFGAPVLTGDFSSFPKIKSVIKQRVLEWETNN